MLISITFLVGGSTLVVVTLVEDLIVKGFSVVLATLIVTLAVHVAVLVQTYLSGVPHAFPNGTHITVVDRRAYATMRLLRTRPHHFLLQFLDDLLAPFVIAVSRLTTPDAPRAAQIETLSNADLLGEILSHCDADGLEKAMSVSRAWRTCGASLLGSESSNHLKPKHACIF
jgi:hypothetical protein